MNFWLLTLLSVFWLSSIAISWKLKNFYHNAHEFLLAGRKVGYFIFIAAITSIFITNINFLGQPSLNLDIGFMGSYLSFSIIIISVVSIFFLKRLWVMSKRFGYITPAEMYRDYFRNDQIHYVIILTSVLFIIPFAGLQIYLAGKILSLGIDNFMGPISSSWIIGLIICIYVSLGGLKSVSYNNAIKFILIIFGLVILSLISFNLTGGLETLSQTLGKFSSLKENETNNVLSIFYMPEIIKTTSGYNLEKHETFWTGTLLFTFTLSMIGIFSTPAFTMWCFSSKSPRPFAGQQVWASTFFVGFILVFFVTYLGISGHILGSNSFINDAGLGISQFLSETIDKSFDSINLFSSYALAIKEASPLLFAILIVSGIAIFQSTAAAFISTTSGIFSRDIYKKFFNPKATADNQILAARLSVILIVLLSLILITFAGDVVWLLSNFGISLSFQMLVPLIAICYFPWFTRESIVAGFIGGFFVLLFTDPIGHLFLNKVLPWGPWPLTIHSSVWAIVINLGLASGISYLRQNPINRVHRQKYFDFMDNQAGIPMSNRYLIPAALVLSGFFIFFGFGPGAIIGNELFGSPNDPTTWAFGLPSIWVWQILFWFFFVGLTWFLAYKLGMSTESENEVVSISDDFGER
jgi:SSS family solute:Na+ symporter